MAVTRTACLHITCHDDSAASGAAVEVKVTMTPPPVAGEITIVGQVATKLFLILNNGELPQQRPAAPPQGVIQ